VVRPAALVPDGLDEPAQGPGPAPHIRPARRSAGPPAAAARPPGGSTPIVAESLEPPNGDDDFDPFT
jgi:hypothetical protein